MSSILERIHHELPDLPDGVSLEEAMDALINSHAAHRISGEQLEEALEQFTNVIVMYAEGHFELVQDENTGNDLVDSIALGMNMLAEEITRQQAELVTARDVALSASRAKSAFLANMSHELRTPLNAIIGYSELIADDEDAAAFPMVVEDVNKILSAGRSLLALITDILDLSKVEAGKMDVVVEMVSARRLVQEVVDTIGPMAAGQGNTIVWEADDVEVQTDAIKLRQVVLNLAANANKFTRNGELSIKLSAVGSLTVEVSDTGIGIAPERLDAIFDPFTQAEKSTTKEHGGTGLGLTIARKFCEMLGGSLSATSELGKGSTFLVSLPLTPVVVTPVGAPPREVAAEGPRVLVIDDDPVVPELVRRHLKASGAAIEWARTGEEGLVIASKRRPHVITLDVLLPGLSGWEVLSRLKRHPQLATIPVVMMTVVSDRTQAATLGADDYLVKPIDRSRLLHTLDRYLPDGCSGEILIVDDQPMVREVLRRNLEKEGHSVTHACDGIEALAAMRSQRPDLVLLDLMMPNLDGFGVIAEVNADPSLAGLPVVVLTAMELSEEDHARLRQGVASVLTKTVPTAEVLEAVRFALQDALGVPDSALGA